MIKNLLHIFKKPKRNPVESLVALQRAEVYYLPIAKSGSTFVRGLFHYLDNDGERLTSKEIHKWVSLSPRANAKDEAKIRDNRQAFTVIREPVDRFLSLYFDKVYGEDSKIIPKVIAHLSTLGMDFSADLSLEGHQENCRILIDWLGQNLAKETAFPVNAHWRRQAIRLNYAKDLNLEILTLDGARWQLQLLLKDVIPGIEQAIDSVISRNRIPRPFSQTELLDTTTEEKIRKMYSADTKAYNAASLKWRPLEPKVAVRPARTIRVMTAGAHPLYSVSMPKVGCTYLKNLFFLLEHGEVYENPLHIHATGEGGDITVSARAITNDVLDDGVGFIVVRDPVARFFSLYFDKVYRSGPRSFDWIAKKLAKNRGYVGGPDISLEQHQINCEALLGFLRYQFTNTPVKDLNPHWRPQIETVKYVAGFDMKPLLLERLDEQLMQISGDKVAGLSDAMAKASLRNTSAKPFTNADIMTPTIARKISGLYREDQALYERVKSGWDQTGQPPKL